MQRHVMSSSPDLAIFFRMANRVLTRILEEPQWVQLIQSMRPALLARLIDHVGLEDAADIVALATTEQLKRIFDEDLWRSSRPGKTETFDAERFGTWLSILLEAGTRFAADKLSEMDEDFLGMAFAKQIYVIDLDALAAARDNGATSAAIASRRKPSRMAVAMDSIRRW